MKANEAEEEKQDKPTLYSKTGSAFRNYLLNYLYYHYYIHVVILSLSSVCTSVSASIHCFWINNGTSGVLNECLELSLGVLGNLKMYKRPTELPNLGFRWLPFNWLRNETISLQPWLLICIGLNFCCSKTWAVEFQIWFERSEAAFEFRNIKG